jgi:hypothetical protein
MSSTYLVWSPSYPDMMPNGNSAKPIDALFPAQAAEFYAETYDARSVSTSGSLEVFVNDTRDNRTYSFNVNKEVKTIIHVRDRSI